MEDIDNVRVTPNRLECIGGGAALLFISSLLIVHWWTEFEPRWVDLLICAYAASVGGILGWCFYKDLKQNTNTDGE